MPLKLCKECRKEFSSNPRRRIYCSDECSNKGVKKTVYSGISKYLKTAKGIKSTRKASQIYYKKNKEKHKAIVKKYLQTEKGKAVRKATNDRNSKKYYQRIKNDPILLKKRREWSNNYFSQRAKEDIEFRIIKNLRTRLYTWFARTGEKKNTSIKSLVGCSKKYLVKYLENKFKSGMTWKNYGEWHIDHIKPLSKFNIKDQKEIEIAMHYTNLQPLWAPENLSKGNRE